MDYRIQTHARMANANGAEFGGRQRHRHGCLCFVHREFYYKLRMRVNRETAMSIPTLGRECRTRTYPMKCRDCRSSVFHFQCTCGSSVKFDSLDAFELHICKGAPDLPAIYARSMRIRIKSWDSKKLEREMRLAERKWRAKQIPINGPVRVSPFLYEVQILNIERSGAIDPLSNFFLEGFVLDITEEPLRRA